SETTDDSYTPPENTTAADPTTTTQTAPTVPVPQDRQPLRPDNIRVGSVDTDASDETGRAQRENLRQSPEQGRSSTQEADPFAPVGIRTGSFILRPSLEQGIRVTTNGDNSASGSSAVLNETTLRLNA
ncbi:outer membrane beta-barrel protein, partial [Alkalihalophilus marmarensis]